MKTILATIAIVFVAWFAAATIYRQQNCVYVLGHWLSIRQTTIPFFCQ